MFMMECGKKAIIAIVPVTINPCDSFEALNPSFDAGGASGQPGGGSRAAGGSGTSTPSSNVARLQFSPRQRCRQCGGLPAHHRSNVASGGVAASTRR